MKYIFNTLIGVGALLLLGAAGSSDLNSISLQQTVIQLLLGGVLIFVSLYGKRLIFRKRGRVIKLREGRFSQGA